MIYSFNKMNLMDIKIELFIIYITYHKLTEKINNVYGPFSYNSV